MDLVLRLRRVHAGNAAARLEARFNPKSHTGTFTDRSYDIGDQPITGLARNDDNGDLYAATDFGVLRLAAGSTQWVPRAPGFRPLRSSA